MTQNGLLELLKHSHVWYFYIHITDGLKILKSSLHTSDNVPELSHVIWLMASQETFYYSVYKELFLATPWEMYWDRH